MPKAYKIEYYLLFVILFSQYSSDTIQYWQCREDGAVEMDTYKIKGWFQQRHWLVFLTLTEETHFMCIAEVVRASHCL